MRDFLLGLRTLGRAPGLAAAAIASIALGIGATTAIFGVVRPVLLAPLPYPAAERLVMLWETAPDNPARWVAPANYLDWRRDLEPAVASMAAFDSVSITLSGGAEPERVRGVSASGSFFTTLGQPVAEGRALEPSDDAPGAPCVAVLSAGLRTRRFPAAPLGSSLVLDGRPCTVVGVLPPSFQFPLQPRAELWINGDRGVPRSFPFPGDITSVRDSHLLFVLARLADDVTVEAAQARLQAVAARLAAAYPDTNTGLGGRVMPLHEAVVGEVRRLLWLLQAAVLVLLLVATANVAHLLIGRAASRQQELAVRVSLGAARGDLARQLLGEALAYALPGGVIGVLLAAWGVDLIVALAPAGLPRVEAIAIDEVVLAVAAALTAATTLIVGLAPLAGAGVTPAATLQAGGVRIAGGRGVRRWHRGLVVAELALAQVVVVGAWLLATSLAAASSVELGYETSGRVAAELTLAPDRYRRPVPEGAAGAAAPIITFAEAVLGDLRGRPGVRAAAAAFTAPLSGAPNRGVRIVGAPAPAAGQEPDADFQVVTPDFFATLGIRLASGRRLSVDDHVRASRVMVINEAFAARYFPGQSPLGRLVEFGQARHEVVGVVADTRYRRVETSPYPTFYVPLAQSEEAWPFLAFVVQTDGDPDAVVAALRAAVRAVDPAQPISSVRSLDAAVADALAGRRFNTWLFALFAGTTMLLAVVGAYGVTAALATARAREFSIRAALGASGSTLRAHILADAVVLAGLASAAGLGLAWTAGRGLEGLLFGVTTRDPWLLAAAAATVTLAALAAAGPAAWRVGRTTPMEALRVDA